MGADLVRPTPSSAGMACRAKKTSANQTLCMPEFFCGKPFSAGEDTGGTFAPAALFGTLPVGLEKLHFVYAKRFFFTGAFGF